MPSKSIRPFPSFGLLLALFVLLGTVFPFSICQAKSGGPALTSLAPARPQGSTQSSNQPDSRSETKQEPAGTSNEEVHSKLEKALEEYRTQIGRVTISQGRGNGSNGTPRARDYHGNLYEYLRNDALDALPHEVRQANGTKSVLRRNQFGFNLTGPLTIPKLYDGHGKTFFSLTYEGTREKISRPFLSKIPTAQQQRGDFSDLVDDAGQPVTIYDPSTTRPNPSFNPALPVSLNNLEYLRDPFPGNVLPKERIDPVVTRLMPYYALPNTNVGPFLRNNFFANAVETNTPNGIVWKLDHSLGTKHKLGWGGRFSNGLDGAAPVLENAANPGPPARRVRSRSSSFSETFNISSTIVNQFNASASYSALVSEGSGDSTTDYAASLGLSGVQPGVFPRFEIWDDYVDLGSPVGSNERYQNASFELYDGLSVRYNKHNLKFSLSMAWNQVNTFRPRNQSGRFDFHGKLTSLPGINNTGNAFAQFLLGMADHAEQSIVLNPSYFRTNRYRLGFGDEYQVTPNFMWSFNLGMQIDTPRREKYDRQSSIDLKLINPANNWPGALYFVARDGRPRTFSPSQINWEPSMGITVNPWGSRKTVLRASYSLWFESFPIFPTSFGTLGFNANPVLVSSNEQLNPVLKLEEGFPQDFVPPPDLSPTAANDLRAEYSEPKGVLPYEQSWQLRLERDLPADFDVRVSYYGSKGTHLFAGNGIDLDPLDPSALVYRDRLNDLNFNLSQRPYPQFRGLAPGYGYPVGSSSYHSCNVTVEKKLSYGLNVSTSYSFSKSIDDMLYGNAPQNSTILKVEKSLAYWDATHQLNIRYLYEFPFGAGRPFFSEGKWIQGLVGGWTVSGNSVFHTGHPVVLHPLFNNTGGVAENLRVDVVDGINPHVANPDASSWFNPAAFDQPADFSLGNGPRTHPTLRNPGAVNFDMSLSKRIPVTDDWSLEFIMEAFNAVNHANLNDPDAVIGSKENPNLNAGRIIGSTGGRVVQLGLRISF
jgi:hypothetical protein